MTILIVNPMNDFHANFFVFKLKQKNTPFIELGSFLSNDYTYDGDQLIYNGKVIEDIHSVYIRGSVMYHPSSLDLPYIDTYNEQIRFKNQLEMLRTWVKIQQRKGARIINALIDNCKHLQLYTLIEAGLPIPKTCITNSFKALQKFRASVGNVVFKPLSGGHYCRELTNENIHKIKDLSGEPVIFQEFIKGKDIRVYVLDGKILSAHEIEKNLANSTIDYRTNSQFIEGDATYKLLELPKHVSDFCIKAANILGLTFTGIDLKLTVEGEFYLLECNSMPIYLDVEFKNNVKITDQMIEYLSEGMVVIHDEAISEEATCPSDPYRVSEFLFDYKEVYRKYYKQQSERDHLMILPLNKDQKEQLGFEEDDDKSFIILNLNDENDIELLQV